MQKRVYQKLAGHVDELHITPIMRLDTSIAVLV